MSSLRWSKLQDFCLRLGLLKTLVAVLPEQRRPMNRDEVILRLRKALYGHSAVAANRGAREHNPSASSESLADRLLRSSASASWGQPIHARTVYKIVEWGLTVGLVVQGNRISERGLLLRSLLNRERVADFLRGDTAIWNPFTIEPIERGLLLYHLSEVDELLFQLAIDLGRSGSGAVFAAADAHALTANALRKVLERAGASLPLEERATFSTVRELSAIIDWEVAQNPKLTKPRSRFAKPVMRRSSARAGVSSRVTTKNADHQAIPRFEQLVDLGILTKPVSPELDEKETERVRKGWTFEVTANAARLAEAFGHDDRFRDPSWRTTAFAAVVGASGVAGPAAMRQAGEEEAMNLFFDAFDSIRRPVGHTPFASAAILTMARGLQAGLIVEIQQLLDVFLRLKREGGLGGKVFFAAGNDVERMYLIVRPEARASYQQRGETGEKERGHV